MSLGSAGAPSEIDRGSPIGPCLPEADLSSYRFPDSAAAYRFEDLGVWTAANAGHFTFVWVGDLWERTTFMRGMEPLLLDLALDPRFVEELLRGLTDHILRTMEILFSRFSFDGVAVSDDYGTQRGMLMSPGHWRRFLKPRLAEIYGLAKRHGRTVFHHSCGNIVPIVGDLLELGLDVLHPIQPEAMDAVQLKREFGADLTFCGGVRTQDLLPQGTPQQVRDKVRRLKDVLGKGGGYILEPGITLQADVPLANLVALVEEARRKGADESGNKWPHYKAPLPTAPACPAREPQPVLRRAPQYPGSAASDAPGAMGSKANALALPTVKRPAGQGTSVDRISVPALTAVPPL